MAGDNFHTGCHTDVLASIVTCTTSINFTVYAWLTVRQLSLDFKLSPCFESCIYSFGYFPGVRLWFSDVSEPSIRWRVPKRRQITIGCRGNTQKNTYKFLSSHISWIYPFLINNEKQIKYFILHLLRNNYSCDTNKSVNRCSEFRKFKPLDRYQ